MVGNIDQETINKVKREMELVKFFVFSRRPPGPQVILVLNAIYFFLPLLEDR